MQLFIDLHNYVVPTLYLGVVGIHNVVPTLHLGAVGLDENADKQRQANAEASAKKELQRKQEKREKEKRELHNQKEIERQNIRAKYQLPKGTDKRNQDRQEAKHSNDNKCLVS